MPTTIQIVQAGDGAFDGTVDRGLFDLNADVGITVPNAVTGIQVLAVAVNTTDPLSDDNKLEDVHVVFSDSLANIALGICFIQTTEGEVSHSLAVNPLNGVIAFPGKIFVFAAPMGVDNYAKVALVAWRRVTINPMGSGIQG